MIRFESVSKSYRGLSEPVVKGVDITIPAGKLVVLIGPSGCGKTTCLKMINRLVKISEGHIFIDGRDNMDYDPIELRRSMGYVIQQTGLFPHMTVRENIEVIPRLERRAEEQISARTVELMNMVGLDADTYLDRYPTQLSGGQLQRIGVARAFATDPNIILMDEPFSALDPITRVQLQDELLFLQAKLKKTIVFVTHDMDEAIKLADMICIMRDGRVVQYDTPENIMKKPADDYVADFVGRNRIWANPEYILAEDIMLPEPLSIPEEISGLRAIELMREKHVTSALVLNSEDKFKGIVLALEIQRMNDRSESIASIVRPARMTAAPHDNIVSLLSKMNESSAVMLPILAEDGKLLGLVTSSSLVTTLSQQYIDYKEVGAQ